VSPIEQLSEAYQDYIAGTDQLYPTEKLPLVRALKGEKTNIDDLEIHQPDWLFKRFKCSKPNYIGSTVSQCLNTAAGGRHGSRRKSGNRVQNKIF